MSSASRPLYGSTMSRDLGTDRDGQSMRTDDRDLNSMSHKNDGYVGPSNNPHNADTNSHRQHSASNLVPRKYKKVKMQTVFDEYEQRGGVLEGYEDLNSDQSSDDDHVLSQMKENHEQSPSNNSYNQF